jgi:hypothetical protein
LITPNGSLIKSRQARMACAVPHGFLAAFRHGETGGQILEGLEGVIQRDAPLEMRLHGFAEGLLDVAANDKDHLAETGAQGIEHRVINDDFPVGSDGINLFESAVTASHAGGHDDEGWFHRLQHSQGLK